MVKCLEIIDALCTIPCTSADTAWVAGGERGYAKDCIGCGECERICPQHLPIIDELQKASELLD